MSKRVIKSDSKLVIDAPSLGYNIPLVNNNSNTNVLSTNIVTGDIEYINRTTGTFNSSIDLQPAGAGETLVSSAMPAQLPGTIYLKSLTQGTGIVLASNANEVSISANTPNSDLENLGAGEAILSTTGSAPVTNVRNFKTLLAGTNISFTPTASDITINAATQNSDMNNLPGGNALLTVTGVLPVTNTRTFKSLVAGSFMTITSAANTLTLSPSNVYNADGALTSNRTVSRAGFLYQHTGNGNTFFDAVGLFRCGATGSSSMMRGSVQFPDIGYANALKYTVAFSTLGGSISYTTTDTLSGIFSQTMPGSPTKTAPYDPAGYQFPSAFGSSFQNDNSPGFRGFNQAGSDLNLITGTYTPSIDGNYIATAKVLLRNDTQVPDFELYLYDAVFAQRCVNGVFNYGTINRFNTYIASNTVSMSTSHNYTFFIKINNSAGTTTMDEVIFTITRV